MANLQCIWSQIQIPQIVIVKVWSKSSEISKLRQNFQYLIWFFLYLYIDVIIKEIIAGQSFFISFIVILFLLCHNYFLIKYLEHMIFVKVHDIGLTRLGWRVHSALSASNLCSCLLDVSMRRQQILLVIVSGWHDNTEVKDFIDS